MCNRVLLDDCENKFKELLFAENALVKDVVLIEHLRCEWIVYYRKLLYSLCD